MIDRLGAALHGLPPETARTHPRCVRVLAIVESLRLRGDAPGAFDDAIAQLGELAREREDELKRFGEAYLPLVDHLEKNDQAKQAAYEVMGRLAGKEVPQEILFFFTEIWRHVLQRAWLKFGPEKREFQVLAKVPEELLWSLTPKGDPEERKAVSQRVPELLKRMRSGLEFARQPAELVTRVLDICFALQTRVLRPQEAAPGSIATVPLPRMGGAREIVMRTVRSGELALQSMDFRDPGQAVPERSACPPGTWMWITLGTQRRALYFSTLSPCSLRAVLVNPDEAPAMAVHLAILDKILQQQGVRIQRPGSLFEATANRAVRGFRAG